MVNALDTILGVCQMNSTTALKTERGFLGLNSKVLNDDEEFWKLTMQNYWFRSLSPAPILIHSINIFCFSLSLKSKTEEIIK